MSVVFETTETKEFKCGTDSDGHKWVKLPVPAGYGWHCWECEKLIGDALWMWMRIDKNAPHCVRCVEASHKMHSMIIETITCKSIVMEDGDVMTFDRQTHEVIVTRKDGSVEKYPYTLKEVEV